MDAIQALQAALDAHPGDGELHYRVTQLQDHLQAPMTAAARRGEAVESRRVFHAPSAPTHKPVSVTVGRTQKRGSVTKAHGMSFTEARRNPEEVVSLAHGMSLAEAKTSILGELPEAQVTEEDGNGDAADAQLESVENRVYAAFHSGVPAVLALMRSDPEHAEIQCWCSDAIASMTAGDTEARKEVYDAGGLDVVLAAMSRFPDDAGVQAKGCWAISNLAADYGKQQYNHWGCATR